MYQSIAIAAGQTVFSPGQECVGFLRLTSGAIRVTMTAANGREVVLYRVRPGEVCLQTFSCLVEGGQYGAEGVVEADLEGEMIPKAVFWRLMQEDEAFRSEVFAAVAQRFGDYQRLVEEVALTGFDTRLARVLLRLCDEAGMVRATHGELAAETASGAGFCLASFGGICAEGHGFAGAGRVAIA